MKNTLHIVIVAAALLAAVLLAFAWRSARRDTTQLNATLATQNTAIQQAQAREQQRDAQLTTALAEIAAQKRAVQTPKQAAEAIPSVLPQLPLPISVQLPNLSIQKPGDTPPPATITVPQADLKPL
jgi:Flp pilus assembly protein TadB